jgi:MFS family permease
MTQGCLEGDESIEWWERTHSLSMNQIHAEVNTWCSLRHGSICDRRAWHADKASMFSSHTASVLMRWRAHPLAPALALALAAFLTQFDVTSVVVVMPSIGRDLGFGVAGFAWVMDAYSLAFAGLLLGAGALADRHGRRRVLLGGNRLFAIAFLICGVAWNGPSLWVARAVQGGAAAFVITGAIASIAGAYPNPAERARAFALMGVISGIAMALGPTLGGMAAAWLGWRSIFLVNLPICALFALAVPRVVVETHEADNRPVDWLGVFLLTLALGIVIETLLQGGRMPNGLWAGALASAAFGAAFVVQQRRQTRPMLDASLFARLEMIGVSAVLLALSIGYWAMLVYLPLFLRAALYLSAQQVGFAMLAATLPMLVLAPVGSGLLLRWGWGRLFAVGLAIVATGDIALSAVLMSTDAMTRFGVTLLGMGCIGTGAALAHPQLSGAVVALVPPAQAGMASAVTVVLRQAGFAIGIAALGAVLEIDVAADNFTRMFALAAGAALSGSAMAMSLLRKPVSDCLGQTS